MAHLCYCTIRTYVSIQYLRARVCRVLLIGTSILLFCPIAGLVGFHTILVSRGKTTNEQVRAIQRPSLRLMLNATVYSLYAYRLPPLRLDSPIRQTRKIRILTLLVLLLYSLPRLTDARRRRRGQRWPSHVHTLARLHRSRPASTRRLGLGLGFFLCSLTRRFARRFRGLAAERS